uniref:Uncharacterized protein n=1 Tax=Arundo donax TaxID=35708 RepID=A0A0A9GB51_ARUDO
MTHYFSYLHCLVVCTVYLLSMYKVGFFILLSELLGYFFSRKNAGELRLIILRRKGTRARYNPHQNIFF